MAVSNLLLRNISVAGGSDVGGLIGQLNGGDITRVKLIGNVTGDGEVGGLIGFLNGDSNLTNIAVIGDVTNENDDTGGIIGRVNTPGSAQMNNVRVEGNISGRYKLGGFVRGGLTEM
jgi:hypothetical protein